jgi:hypothetical protein
VRSILVLARPANAITGLVPSRGLIEEKVADKRAEPNLLRDGGTAVEKQN